MVLGEVDGSMICADCGVTKLNPMNDRDLWRGRPDRVHKYMDAHGTYYSSKEEVPCPFFIGALDIAVGDLMMKEQKVKERVADFEGDMEILAERMRALEKENAQLREQVAAKQDISEEALMVALVKLAEKVRQAAPKELEDKSLGGILDLEWDEEQRAFVMPERADEQG